MKKSQQSNERGDGRKVILAMNVSIDGFVSGPNGELDWVWPTMGPELGAYVFEFLSRVDTILIGRTTYLEQAAHWPTQSDPVAAQLNSHRKIVFASHPIVLSWNNSQLAQSDAAAEIARLKEEKGKDIYVTGGAMLGRTLGAAGLIDEYDLFVHPIALGAGKRLFADGAATSRFTLEQVRSFSSGAVHMHHRRQRP